MFPRPLRLCFSLKRRLICENRHTFVRRLPIKFFYFEDFRWPFFGKITGQKQRISFSKNDKNETLQRFLWSVMLVTRRKAKEAHEVSYAMRFSPKGCCWNKTKNWCFIISHLFIIERTPCAMCLKIRELCVCYKRLGYFCILNW